MDFHANPQRMDIHANPQRMDIHANPQGMDIHANPQGMDIHANLSGDARLIGNHEDLMLEYCVDICKGGHNKSLRLEILFVGKKRKVGKRKSIANPNSFKSTGNPNLCKSRSIQGHNKSKSTGIKIHANPQQINPCKFYIKSVSMKSASNRIHENSTSNLIYANRIKSHQYPFKLIGLGLI
ncbi:hypothetical protein CDAR_2321 [Caerostris darwini]|uniref:Uncharacterized protein n=1 Tax=Caerostris darwini TaxID=1538125 RepID=A0AAV4W6P9_9ARAC|nr:hypothetical protein CDAR_2321 [Caerostris darwini]